MTTHTKNPVACLTFLKGAYDACFPFIGPFKGLRSIDGHVTSKTAERQYLLTAVEFVPGSPDVTDLRNQHEAIQTEGSSKPAGRSRTLVPGLGF